jgi:hypothetical protein
MKKAINNIIWFLGEVVSLFYNKPVIRKDTIQIPVIINPWEVK